ncbi:MAG: hypothetical protein HY908_34815, partial [Myxococcales bacterium]|nr:hypothetical protein [Myxococcales bacterium]
MKWTRVALASVALAAGCSPRASQGPADALHAYAEALEAGRADDAYQLLSDDAKRQLSLEAFRRIVKESHDDVSEIARTLSRAASDPVVTATVQAPSGDELVLVYEQGRWRIDGTGIDRYGQATPRQALLGFLRAFERGRYDILGRYMPDAEREAELALAATPAEAPAAPPAEPAGTGDAGAPAASAAASGA